MIKKQLLRTTIAVQTYKNEKTCSARGCKAITVLRLVGVPLMEAFLHIERFRSLDRLEKILNFLSQFNFSNNSYNNIDLVKIQGPRWSRCMISFIQNCTAGFFSWETRRRKNDIMTWSGGVAIVLDWVLSVDRLAIAVVDTRSVEPPALTERTLERRATTPLTGQFPMHIPSIHLLYFHTYACTPL